MIKLSDYVFQFLEKKGVNHVFMLPGGGAMHLVDSLGKSNLEYTCCQHEQAASIAAEAYGQHSNHLGVALVTSGPGGTNAITGVAAGWIDSTPMLVISGQAKSSDLVGDKGVRQIGSQEVPIVDMVKPITKYVTQILEPNQIRYCLEKAYYEATTDRPGPVWIDIPLDVQGTMIEENQLEVFHSIEKIDKDYSKEIKQILTLLQVAKKPLLLAGNGIKLSGGEKLLYKFLNQWKIPVQTTWKTIDMIGESHPLYAGHPGIMGDRGANLILQEADLLLSIGSRLDTSLTAFNESNFGKCAKKIIIDIDQKELDRMNISAEMKLACDAKRFLKELLDAQTETSNSYDPWVETCHMIRAKHPVVTTQHREQADYVSAYYFIEQLGNLLTENDIIVPESSGGAGEITYQAFSLKYGQKMKNAAGLGSMGFGLPYAIGSCLANNRKRTILINGDGAFQLNIQELETVRRLGLPLKIFIWNNNGYASIRMMQAGNFEGRFVGSDEASGFSVPSISKIGQAYGFKTCIINNNEELNEKLEEILNIDDMILCELKVSPQETVSPRVKAIKLPNGKMESDPLECMWPY